MEAIFLGDPGHFLCLDDGARYYLWRRAKLKMQGKSVLTGRLYPNFPPFQFDFTTTFHLPISQTGRPFKFNELNKHGTYAYFYYSWRRHEFPGPGGADVDGDFEKSGDFGNAFNDAHTSNAAYERLPLDEFLHKAGFWNELDPHFRAQSAEGNNLRGAALRNMMGHMDIAWHELALHTGKHITLPNGIADAISYLEASLEFWGDLTWKRPEGVSPVPRKFKVYHRDTQAFPYIFFADQWVLQREGEVRRACVEGDGCISPAEGQLDWKEGRLGLRGVTMEEADFMDRFLDCGERVEEKGDVEMTGFIKDA